MYLATRFARTDFTFKSTWQWSAPRQVLAAAVRQRRAASQSAAVASAASANGVERSLSFAELGEIDTDNLRVRMIRPLRPPACLIEELESDVAVRQQVP